MKAARIALLAIVCSVPVAALAQWQWVDKDGRKVFSDKAPPPEIAPDRIVKRPRGSVVPAVIQTAEPGTATGTTATTASNLPKPSGKDKVLEEKKKQAEAADAEKKKAEEAKVASARAENCARAKASKANFDSGVRISRVNDKGEREIMDDAQRAVEVKMLSDVIARDCK
jgi:hypothetical protein